jgi:CYTH domain-containing protein
MNNTNEQTEIELELTYLAAALPVEIKLLTPKRLVDAYVPDSIAEHPRLRIRQKGNDYQITKKVPLREGDASAHTEMTIPLEESEFLALSSVSKRRIIKDRYELKIDGYPAEVDVFLGDLKGLVLIDFEFNSEEEKSAFIQPNICLADVTQENFIAGGLLAGKKYADIKSDLDRFGYKVL